MTSKIAVSNQKGGVGKTTIAINVAGALADRGHAVLFVDIDPQGHGTEGLGIHEAYDTDPPHFGTVLTELSDQPMLTEVIVHHDEFDVVPANIDMFTLESDLTGAMRGRERLSMALDDLTADYDFIIVDCPPSLGYLTDNALIACQNVLIPALAEGTSIRALEILYDQIDSIEEGYDTEVNDLGIVANRVDQDGEAEEMMEWLQDTFSHIPVWEIRKRVALKRAWNNGKSIFTYEESCDMEPVFDEIAAQLEEVNQ